MTPPHHVLLLKVDTLGDLVLFAPALRALAAGWPATRFHVLIRAAYAELAPLLAGAAAPNLAWLTTGIDPFAQGPAQCAAETGRLLAQVRALAPEVIVAATSRRNWLEALLAQSAPPAGQPPRRLALGHDAVDPFFNVQLRLADGVSGADAFPERIGFPAEEADWQRNFRLVDALLGRAVARTPPQFQLDDTMRARARDFLAARQLAPRRFVVCAAAGFANVALKTWPAENFAAALRHLHQRHGLPALLIGHESERDYLEALRARLAPPSAAPAALPAPATLFLGRTGELPLLAALIAEAALFFGNDTGALHLAGALDVPVVGVYGGGTWPRFVPAARRSVAVVQPLPCFGCGWDCAFGDAPCIKGLTAGDAIAALDRALGAPRENVSELVTVEHLSSETRTVMGAAAARYRSFQADHLTRQLMIEEKERAIAEKEAAIDEKEREIHRKEASLLEKEGEIESLKRVCDERERVILRLDADVRDVLARLAIAEGERMQLEKTFATLPRDAETIARAYHGQAVHVRNLDALVILRDREIAELKASLANHLAQHHDLELAKHYGKLLAEKETVIQSLRRATIERETVIKELTANTTGLTAALRKAWIAGSAWWRERVARPFDEWLFEKVVTDYWMQIGVLRHYDPKPLRWDERLLAASAGRNGTAAGGAKLPQIALVTPSYGQEKFIERTMRSILDQAYPRLLYVVQDGGSKDRSPEIIARHAAQLRHWESVRDKGQADAVRRGFEHIARELAPEDLMAWLNSDDLLAPGALRFVGEYFAAHPEVDVIYGHRIIIDDDDRDVGRWIMPRHDPETLEWIDYVPQETLFWRKRAWDRAGGIDPTYQFALDWDLLARFQQAGCRLVRVPYFLGAFRVHAEQKTSQAIHTTGADEMRRIRTRFHGENQDNFETINAHARHARFWGAITARLHEVGIRW
jgi:ADP-heptose:LPS heptosyltransferase/GT2 family glycosyltransferase